MAKRRVLGACEIEQGQECIECIKHGGCLASEVVPSPIEQSEVNPG